MKKEHKTKKKNRKYCVLMNEYYCVCMSNNDDMNDYCYVEQLNK